MNPILETGTVAIGYSRKSRVTDSETMANRQANIRRIASLHGLTLVDVVEEMESGGNRDRPGLARVLDCVRRGVCHTIVTLDRARISRDARHWMEIEDLLTDCGAVLVTEEGVTDYRQLDRQKLPQRVIDAVHEWEREECGRRMRRAYREKLAKGIPHGGPVPYGYQLDKATIYAPSPQYPLLCEILRRVSQGSSLRSIAMDFNARHIPTPGQVKGYKNAGEHWDESAIRCIVVNPVYAGYLCKRFSQYGKRRVKLPEPILSDAEGPWQHPLDIAAYWRLMARLNGPTRPGMLKVSLLSGLLVCSQGRPMGNQGRHYECRCKIYAEDHAGATINRERIEAHVKAQITWLVARLPSVSLPEHHNPANDAKTLANQYKAAQQLVRQKERSAAAMMQSEAEQIANYGRELYLQAAANVRQEYESARAEVSRIERLLQQPDVGQALEALTFVQRLGDRLWTAPASTEDRQRQIIRAFVAGVTFPPHKPGQRYHTAVDILWNDWCASYAPKPEPLPKRWRINRPKTSEPTEAGLT